jgi:1,2-beta-oligoglucan phosphorylase
MTTPVSLSSTSGLRVQINANGSLRRIDHRDVILNLFPGNEIEGGPTNLYLRRRDGSGDAIPLLGPASGARYRIREDGFAARGTWNAVRYEVSLRLAQDAPAWFWHVTLENTGDAPLTVDLIHAQDLALSDYGAVRQNEYYVSQYLDHTPLAHPERGAVLAVRQNQSVGGRHPWAVLGSLHHATSFATDALQFHGVAGRSGDGPAGLRSESLPGKRHQHEHSMAVLQDAAVRLDPGARVSRGFFGWLEPDHPAATSAADLAFVDRALALPEAAPRSEDAPEGDFIASSPTWFSAGVRLACRDLAESEITDLFGSELRHAEREEGQLHSFFAGANRHVVLAAKERAVLRPHGQILRTGDALVPDEASLTSTAWMSGVFHSMVTQGHVSINRFLSTTHSYLGLFRSHGQRIFVECAGGWQLLDVPSAFEMDPSGCRWIYEHAGGRIEVRSRASVSSHELLLEIEVVDGAPCRFLVSSHVALGGDDGADAVPLRAARDERGVALGAPPDSDVGRRFPYGCFRIDPVRGTAIEALGGDELLFADGRSRNQPFLVLVTAASRSAGFRITGHLVAPAGSGADEADRATDAERSGQFWRDMSGPLQLLPVAASPLASEVAQLQEILPWFAHDALIHYLAPRGLEQYSGGGWGTRDVCQGPVELLLSLGRYEPVRDLLLRVYRNQNADGDWPQWFMFFERERNIRPGDSHGDIVFWPVLALAQYLLASGDAGILDEAVPFFHAQGDEHAEHATIWQHVERALGVIAARVIPGTQLAAYGHGDWNDSLQPVDPAMRERLCSAWTVTLQHQTLCTLAAALRQSGRSEHAPLLEATAAQVRDEFQRLLIADGVLAGFTYFREGGGVDRLLHPSDESTGIHFRLLPMIHAILSDLFTPEQARTHVALIREHLLAPDGARLFDRPPPYHGGLQRHFQRAESSTFFGREIGILYTHAHLRYAEAMAHWGDADATFFALRQANPIGLRDAVARARPRQRNCYTSSSDACFADRYEAASRYDELKAGAIDFEAGWRVYSSGAGISMQLIRGAVLGLRESQSCLTIDPVLPRSLDGLRASIEVAGVPVDVVYAIRELGHGPTKLELNGAPLAFATTANPYRAGAAVVSMDVLRPRLEASGNTLVVTLR